MFISQPSEIGWFVSSPVNELRLCFVRRRDNTHVYIDMYRSVTCLFRHTGQEEVLLYPCFDSAPEDVGAQRHNPAALPPVKRDGTYGAPGWMCPRANLDGAGQEKISCTQRGSNQISQSHSVCTTKHVPPRFWKAEFVRVVELKISRNTRNS